MQNVIKGIPFHIVAYLLPKTGFGQDLQQWNSCIARSVLTIKTRSAAKQPQLAGP